LLMAAYARLGGIPLISFRRFFLHRKLLLKDSDSAFSSKQHFIASPKSFKLNQSIKVSQI
jgi:hypothetical protein